MLAGNGRHFGRPGPASRRRAIIKNLNFGKTFYRPLEDVVYELLQDPRGKDFLNYEAKPIFLGDKRVFGPLRSAGFWEELEKEHPGKT
eukprot:48626-Rhodomonas_salina.1